MHLSAKYKYTSYNQVLLIWRMEAGKNVWIWILSVWIMYMFLCIRIIYIFELARAMGLVKQGF